MFAPIRKQQKVLLSFTLLADLLTVYPALIATWYTRTVLLGPYLPEFYHSQDKYIAVFPVLCLIFVGSWWSAGMYGISLNQSPFSGLTIRIRAFFSLAVAMMAASYLVKTDYSRLMLFMFMAFAGPLNLVLRRLAAVLARAASPFKQAPSTLVIGSGEYAERVIRSLERLPEPRHRLKGVLTEHPQEHTEIAGVPVIGTANDLPRLATSLSVDEVFFASGSMSRNEMLRLVNQVEKPDIVFMLVTDLFEIATGISDLSSISRMPVVEIGTSDRGALYWVVKRLTDIIVSLLLIVLLLPLMACVWILLRLFARGTPVFRQKRVGRHGKTFILYKFRTMKPDAGEYEVAPLDAGDTRVTPLGKLLRKTSLDELPQLFNVLRGHMSMVGPRPEMDFIVRDYNAWQRRRLEIKPGITGLWQIMGRKDLPLHENLEYDFYYMRNQSMMLDLAIMARTAVTILKGRGAY
jgi:exopolysaccharide biosynthesis polyprenyl glycosylphosphotransferase